MIHPSTQLQIFPPPLGRGVVATEPLPRGTIIYVRDPLDQCIPPEAWAAYPPLLQEVVDTYSYGDRQGNRILGWDLSKYVNHSCCANTMATAYGFEVVVRDIAIGEPITAEYGLLDIFYEYDVDCGCGQCRGKVGPGDRALYGEQWDPIVRMALEVTQKVPQPLWELVALADREALQGWLEGRLPYRAVALAPPLQRNSPT